MNADNRQRNLELLAYWLATCTHEGAAFPVHPEDVDGNALHCLRCGAFGYRDTGEWMRSMLAEDLGALVGIARDPKWDATSERERLRLRTFRAHGGVMLAWIRQQHSSEVQAVDRAPHEDAPEWIAEMRVTRCTHPIDHRARLPQGEYCRSCEGVQPTGLSWTRASESERTWIASHPEEVTRIEPSEATTSDAPTPPLRTNDPTPRMGKPFPSADATVTMPIAPFTLDDEGPERSR
jgi:hypothetical protein